MIVISILCVTLWPTNIISEDTGPSRGSDHIPIAGLPNDQWPGFRGGPARTGNTTGTGPSYFYELWSAATAAYWGSPVVMYDQIYLCTNGATRCYNMTGGLQWSYNAGNLYGSPLVHNGRVYFSASNGDLYCLDANATGSGTTTNYWIYNPTSVRFAAGSPVTDGKKIYYSTQDASGLHAVWINNGTKVWNASLGGSTVTESSPAYWNGRVYCGGGESYDTGTNDLYCINASNGNLLWKFATGDDVVSTPAVEYGRVYFGSMDAKVYCVDAVGSGGSTTKYWEYNTNAGAQGVYGSASVAYGRVYIGATNSHLYCFDAYGSGGSTTVYWDQTITPTGSWGICGSPAVTSDYVFIGNSMNGMHCRNRASGTEVWSHTFPSYTYGLSSPAIIKDMVFVASDNGDLYAMGFDIELPKIESSDPTDEEINVDVNQIIRVTFDEELDTSTLTTTNINLKDSQDNDISGVVSWDATPTIVYFTPDSHLIKDETYTFTMTIDVTDSHANQIDGNGNGIADVTGDEYIFNFTTVLNYPPSIGNIPTLKPKEDVLYKIDLSNIISDLDTPDNELILAQDSSYVTLNGFELQLLYPEGVVTDVINLSVSDDIFTIYKEINVEVIPVDDPPVITPVDPLTLKEDIKYSLDLQDHVSDIDTPITELFFDIKSTEYAINAGHIEKDGSIVNFTYPDAITSDQVNVTVYDQDPSEDNPVYFDIEISITPVNDPPVLAELPAINVVEDEQFQFNLFPYISDIDTDEKDLEILVKSDYVTVTGYILAFNYPGKISSDNVNVMLFDGQLYDNATLKVLVESVNDPPVVSIMSPTDGDIYEFEQTIDLLAIVSDPDLAEGNEESLSFYWSSSESGAIGYEQNVTGITIEPGEHLITLSVTDSQGEEVSVTISIQVKEGEVITPPKKNDTKPPESNETDDKSSSTTNTFGIVIGVVMVIIIAIIALFAMMMQKKKKGKLASDQAPQLVADQLQVPLQTDGPVTQPYAYAPQSPTDTPLPMDPYQLPPGHGQYGQGQGQYGQDMHTQPQYPQAPAQTPLQQQELFQTQQQQAQYPYPQGGDVYSQPQYPQVPAPQPQTQQQYQNLQGPQPTQYLPEYGEDQY